MITRIQPFCHSFDVTTHIRDALDEAFHGACR
jgi:hypothetical protein